MLPTSPAAPASVTPSSREPTRPGARQTLGPVGAFWLEASEQPRTGTRRPAGRRRLRPDMLPTNGDARTLTTGGTGGHTGCRGATHLGRGGAAHLGRGGAAGGRGGAAPELLQPAADPAWLPGCC